MRIFAVTFAAATFAALSATPAAAQTSRYGYGMANPASTYCAQIGGRSINRYDSDGSARDYCRLRDGREVDEWQLYRNSTSSRDSWSYNNDRTGPRYGDRARYGSAPASYCSNVGGQYYTARPTTGGATRGWCRTRDGRTWDAWQLYQQYGNGQGYGSRGGYDSYGDNSYRQQYRSYEDRSDGRYDNRDDNDDDNQSGYNNRRDDDDRPY